MGSMVQEPSKQAIGNRIASGHGSQASSLRSVQMSGSRQVQWLVRTAQRRWIAILKATVSALSTPEPAPAKLRAYRCWSQASTPPASRKASGLSRSKQASRMARKRSTAFASARPPHHPAWHPCVQECKSRPASAALPHRLRRQQLRFASLPAAPALCSGMGCFMYETSKQAI